MVIVKRFFLARKQTDIFHFTKKSQSHRSFQYTKPLDHFLSFFAHYCRFLYEGHIIVGLKSINRFILYNHFFLIATLCYPCLKTPYFFFFFKSLHLTAKLPFNISKTEEFSLYCPH